MRNILGIILVILSFSSCSCEPEQVIKFAFKGMETFIGEGFMPSPEIAQLGGFQTTSVNLSQSSDNDITKGTIFLKLENGDPVLLGNQPEILARKCAEIYLRDFKKADNYQEITIQFIQTDPTNPDNFAMQEYTFDVDDF